MPVIRKTTIEISEGFLGIADIHIKYIKPRYRIDDYKETCLNKIKWCVDYANKHNLRILIAGDIFDSVRERIYIVNKLIEILLKAKFTPIVGMGQHDLLFHSKNIDDSPLYTLLLSEALLMQIGRAHV